MSSKSKFPDFNLVVQYVNHYTTGSLPQKNTLEENKNWKKFKQSLIIRLFSVISKTLVGIGGLALQQRCSWCVLQPKSTGKSTNRATSSDCLVSYPRHSLALVVLLFSRDAVGVFYSPCQLGKAQTEPYHRIA